MPQPFCPVRARLQQLFADATVEFTSGLNTQMLAVMGRSKLQTPRPARGGSYQRSPEAHGRTSRLKPAGAGDSRHLGVAIARLERCSLGPEGWTWHGTSSQPQRASRLRNNTPRTIFLDGSTCICTGQRWTLPQVGSAFGANPARSGSSGLIDYLLDFPLFCGLAWCFVGLLRFALPE
jgi:hypothetical protein